LEATVDQGGLVPTGEPPAGNLRSLERAVEGLAAQSDLVRRLLRERRLLALADLLMIGALCGIAVVALLDGTAPWTPVTVVGGFVALARSAMHAEMEGEIEAARECAALKMREVEQGLRDTASLLDP